MSGPHRIEVVAEVPASRVPELLRLATDAGTTLARYLGDAAMRRIYGDMHDHKPNLGQDGDEL